MLLIDSFIALSFCVTFSIGVILFKFIFLFRQTREFISKNLSGELKKSEISDLIAFLGNICELNFLTNNVYGLNLI